MPHQAIVPVATDLFERAMNKHIDTLAPSVEKADLTIYWHFHVQTIAEEHPLIPGQITQNLSAIIEMWVNVGPPEDRGMVHVNPMFPISLLAEPDLIEQAAVEGLKALNAQYEATAKQKGWIW